MKKNGINNMGFTLIELLAVIVVLGVVVSVSIFVSISLINNKDDRLLLLIRKLSIKVYLLMQRNLRMIMIIRVIIMGVRVLGMFVLK